MLGFKFGYDILVAILPFFHIYGQVVVLLTGLAKGCKIISMPKFEPEPYLNAVTNHRVRIKTAM